MKPPWLNKKISLKDCSEMKSILKNSGLNTVCEEAKCPNIGECFAKKQATFIILGAVCTRGCLFCGIKKGEPDPVDTQEPFRIADLVSRLGLKHVVITSVTRDDLSDGGASLFSETIEAVRKKNKDATIEVLIPDFKGEIEPLEVLAKSNPEIIAHNIETVPRLYQKIRKGASYARSLKVLKILKRLMPDIPLKSGLMLGLGEEQEEVYKVFDDLVNAGCIYLSLGQYLAPSKSHFPVQEYIKPKVFDRCLKKAIAAGFRSVKSAPYVRSSYLASEY